MSNRHRRYYESHREECRARSRAWKKAHGTNLQQAMRKGPEAVEELRRKNRAYLAARRLKRRDGGKPQRGSNAPKLIVPIPPADVTTAARNAHADLAWLIEQVGAIAVRRLRHKSGARRDFAVWTAARDSLPARPVAAEFAAWLAALSRGEHGGPPLSVGTLRNIYFRAAALYDTGKLLGQPIRNPVREAREPTSSQTAKGAYSWRVIVEGFPILLAAAAADWRERAFFLTLRYTGLRISEVLGLRREHVLHLPGGEVHLQVASQRRHFSSVTGADAPLKHERQRRILPLANSELVNALLRARRETPSKVWTRGPDHQPFIGESPYLFPFGSSRVAQLQQKLHALLPDLPAGVGWHAFRHAFSAEARIVARVSIDELSQWLGHSSPSVTQGYLRTLLGEQPDLASFAARVAAAQVQRPVAAAPSNVTALKKS